MPHDVPSLCDSCRCSFLPPSTIPPPELLGKLRAMQTPSPSERSIILDRISEAKAKLLLYEAELERLEETTEKLEVEAGSIQQSIDEYTSLLAPVRKLPNELLTSIFEECRAGDADRSTNCLTSPHGLAPLNLALVCRLWRDIAISTPRLWCTISVDLEDAETHSRDILKLFLRLSQQLPLRVHLFDNPPSGDFDDDSEDEFQELLSSEIVEILATESHRFDYIQFAGYAGNMECLVLDESVVLPWTGVSIDHRFEAQISQFAVPRLQYLQLVNVHHLYGIPLHQITRLSIEHHASGSLEILPKFDNVTEAMISFVYSADPLPAPSVYSTSISSLSLIFGPLREDPILFFKSITLPSLTSLTISSTNVMCRTLPTEALEALEGMLQRSQCALETLINRNIWIADTEPLLAAIPTLTYLVFEDPLFVYSLLFSLTYTPSYGEDGIVLDAAELTLPKLKHFSLGLSDDPTHWKLLANMLESRWPPRTSYSSRTSDASCLEQVSLRFVNPIDADVKMRLQELQHRGLKIWYTRY